jgi:hypothetical protein
MPQQPYPMWPTKDNDDALDYAVNWSSWLDPGDRIITSTWYAPSGLTCSNDSISTDGKKTLVWISGGTGVSSEPAAFIRNKITTAQGRTVTKTIGLPIGPS